VKREVPEATLHVSYDFDKQMGMRAWEHSQMAEYLWDCKMRLTSTPGVVNLGALTREQVIREQLECQVHCMPSDPPGVGTQTHGIMQMECGSAGAALVLSDVEAFPEVFGDGSTIMPVIGKYVPGWERRCTAQDYASVVVTLMRSPELWQVESRKARALAEQHTWTKVLDAWDVMLTSLVGVPA
jgi:glycosyltransferase involved in cell wall biosynthesis